MAASRAWWLGLGIGALLGMIFLVVQIFRMGGKSRIGLASTPYSLALFHHHRLSHGACGGGRRHAAGAALLVGAGYFNRVRYAHIHIGALYWHFVDAVWLAVFFTFYLTPLLGLRA